MPPVGEYKEAIAHGGFPTLGDAVTFLLPRPPPQPSVPRGESRRGSQRDAATRTAHPPQKIAWSLMEGLALGLWAQSDRPHRQQRLYFLGQSARQTGQYAPSLRCGHPTPDVAEVLVWVFTEGDDLRAFLVSHPPRYRNSLYPTQQALVTFSESAWVIGISAQLLDRRRRRWKFKRAARALRPPNLSM